VVERGLEARAYEHTQVRFSGDYAEKLAFANLNLSLEQDQPAPETHPNTEHCGRDLCSIVESNSHSGLRMCLKPTSELIPCRRLRMMNKYSACLFIQTECFKHNHVKRSRLRSTAGQ
jgi:hypothetical protein